MTKTYIILDQPFFNRKTLDVARDLLGKYLVRSINNHNVALMITEVEAYVGPHDLACHARVGKTARTEVMFGPAGHFYVHLIYGMYWMLNIVTGPEDYPSGVLIRGVSMINGPGKLTRHLDINKSLNTKPAIPNSGLWVEDRGVIICKKDFITTPRIGVTYAGPVWSQKPYRYVLKS